MALKIASFAQKNQELGSKRARRGHRVKLGTGSLGAASAAPGIEIAAEVTSGPRPFALGLSARNGRDRNLAWRKRLLSRAAGVHARGRRFLGSQGEGLTMRACRLSPRTATSTSVSSTACLAATKA